MFDVVIAGAGPAGLVAASRLARAGAQVAVIDKTQHAGTKIGECLPGAASRLLIHLQLPPLNDGAHRLIHGASSLWAGTLENRDFISEPDGAGYRIDRRQFERNLERAALKSGARRIAGLIRGFQRCRRSGWRIDTGAEVLTTSFLVDATGRHRAIARHLGATACKGVPLVALWAIGSPVAVERDATDRTLIETMDDGWWYGAYLPNRRPLAIWHTSAATARDMLTRPEHWQRALAATKLLSQHIDPTFFRNSRLTAENARHSQSIPALGDGWASCGDAALAFDPIASQGIFNALASADMLTRSLCSNRLHDYAHRLSTIADIYHRRRNSFYQDGARHHRGGFWTEQASRP
jgi:flavin-dependent dehydrogenase